MGLSENVPVEGPLPNLGGEVPLVLGLLVFCLGLILIWAPVPGWRAVLGYLASGAKTRSRG